MSLVPEKPAFSGPIPETAVIPVAETKEPSYPDNWDDMSDHKKKVYRGMFALAANRHILDQQEAAQRKRVAERCSSEQWLDENEREWAVMDEMIRSRPWATRKDEPFPYPFRKATNLMRSAEGGWVGDDDDPPNRPWTRAATAPCEVLTHLRPVAEHPPFRRVILFTPDLGSDRSFDSVEWSQLTPLDSCDVWIVSWQGWSDFDEMIEQLLFKVLSFADAVSTVWYAHSFGAIVAYECLKRFEGRDTPNLPVALMVSACPAPEHFEEKYQPWEKYPWLDGLSSVADFDKLTKDQQAVLKREFQAVALHEADPGTFQAMLRGFAPSLLMKKYAKDPEFTEGQKAAIVGDLQVVRSYKFAHANKKQVPIPVVAVCHDEDPLVDAAAMEGWKDYGPPDSAFDLTALEDLADGEVLAEQGHGFAHVPVKELVGKVVEISDKYQLKKEVDDILPDFGPTDNPLPAEIDCIVVGAGISGIAQAKLLADSGRSVVVLEKFRTIGGIWMFFANNFSRVNSSEPAYRIVNHVGPAARPNEDHSPRHDILRDIFTMAAKYLYGKIICNVEVTQTTKREDGSWDVMVKEVLTGKMHKIHAGAVAFHVNRRIGKRRDLTWPNGKSFRGEEVYGYANEVIGLNFWGKRVIVVGAGAFAFENLRTALEHGAKHCTILGRRSGTTCPKWIDMIAFLRPLDPWFNTNKNGNIISFDCWRQCYTEAGLMTPECWDEGLLKPHNHTVSVSDLAFIGGYHGMVDLKVGEIKNFRLDGQGVELMDGTSMDVDIIIKATGFHRNTDVPAISGYDKIHSFALLDFNLSYGAEPLLDGGQFGSTKGRMENDWDEGGEEQDIIEGYQAIGELAEHGAELDMQPKGNPFGSAYVGGMLVSAYLFKWFVDHPDFQKDLLEVTGKPVQSSVDTWASQTGQNQIRTLHRLMARFAQK